MHWKKNRKAHPEAKGQIIQADRCPGCGVEVRFFYGEHGRICHECKKARDAEVAELRGERRGRA